MTDPARGPTTEELRARVLAHEQAEAAKPRRVVDILAEVHHAPGWRDALDRRGASWHTPPAAEGRTFYDPARPPLDSEGAERQ